ncbi:hypothetical protein PINS_up004660 [Pythium insidiosum]|nr:hypothetical protein PINS_up004660 [Pythium insidiosum]
MSDSSSHGTFANQDALPRLPVPELEETLSRYLESLRPFLSQAEVQHVTTLIDDFKRPGGDGEALQKTLLQRAQGHTNWLAEWWEYAAYLSDRTPIAPFINMVSGFGVFLDFDRPVSQARRAAETIRYTCEYLELLKQGKVPTEKMGGRTLCMNMFRRLFSSCRIPGTPVDSFERVDPVQIRHIVVLCDGRIFSLPVYDDRDELLTIGDLESQLLHILQQSEYINKLRPDTLLHNDSARHIGALTSLNRDEWAAARQELIDADGYNKEILETIQRSLFAICLDEKTPTNPSDLVKACAAWSCGNRWYDKSFQYVIFQNGMVGANMEHANADATILQSMYRWLGERYLNRIGGYETFIESRHHSLSFLPPPELLKWKLTDAIQQKIADAVASFEDKAQALRTMIIRNKKYGKASLKAVKLFPDTFVQMAIQLAGYKLYKEVVPTYESAHTRMFQEGRTETIRTVTVEVKEWLEAMQDASVPRHIAHEKLQRAMTRHKQNSIAALTGAGIDRHLLGLQIAAYLAGQPPHALFTDPSYVKSGGGGNFVLSTSNVSGYPWLWGGFVPMVPHGIGVCYGTEADFLGFMITSFDEHPQERQVPNVRPRFTVEEFQRALFESFDEIYALVREHREQPAKL